MDPIFKAAELTPTKDGQYEYVASDETVDRYGDIVRVAGWDLRSYKQNPVVLFGHRHDTPVGLATKVWIESKKLMVRIKLAEVGTSDFIDTLRKLLDQRIVRAVSVGFIPTVPPKYIRDPENDRITGMEFVGQELLENSLVTVPANPNALQVARSLNVPEAHLQRVFAKPATGASVFLARQKAILDMTRLGVSSRSMAGGNGR